MSKFIDRLKQVSQPLPQPMGFRPNNAGAERPRIQLIAGVQGNVTAEKLTPADAVIVTDGKTCPQNTVKGIWIKNTDKVDGAIKAGADFIVMTADSGVIPSDKRIGKVLEISAAVTDVMLRTVNDLPVDAVLLQEDGAVLTWQKLMLFQRFASIVDKPVLVNIAADTAAEELQLIWETGISGLVVKISGDAEADSLSLLHDKIDGLKFPSRRKKEKMHATLPQMSSAVEEPHEDDEEEDE